MSYDDYICICLILAILICAIVLFTKKSCPVQQLPGPRGFPLVGVMPHLRSFPEKILEKWNKKFGPLFTAKIGNVNLVVIGSQEIAYEAFAKQDCFNDRPQSIPVFNERGLFLLNFTNYYKEQRRFGLNTLREFGMGRRSLEPQLVETAVQLCNSIDHLCDGNGKSQPFDIHQMLYESISTVISYMLFSKDLVKENEELKGLIKFVMTPRKENYVAGLFVFAPFLRYLPFFFGVWKDGIRFRENIHSIIKEEVCQHQKSPCYDNPRDFIDCFLKETEDDHQKVNKGGDAKLKNTYKNHQGISDLSKNTKNNWKPGSSFCIEQLVGTVRDFYLAGIDTTSSIVSWIILFLCKYPDVQKKLQLEIDDALGQDGVPQMSESGKLPFLKAVIREVSRLRPPIPLGVPHLASHDATLMGYDIPKGSIILTNIWAIHHDERNWPDPHKFLPERHLDENGRFVKSLNWMIFNTGGRNCPGQQLAMMELFILVGTLFRRFSFALPPSTTPDMNGDSAVSLRPLPYKIIVTQR